MNIKAKLQRFWTLSQNRKGFTLVELIVVIAILAILAGVAIPVYNGYIKKAQTAADQQLLDSISTAFAAACIANGKDHVKAAGTTLSVNADGTIASGDAANGYSYSFTIRYDGGIEEADAVAIVENFALFYAGNETAKFKGEEFVGKALILDAEGKFEAYGETTNMTYELSNGQKVTLTFKEGDLASFKGSLYAEMSKDGSLLTNVDKVVEWANQFGGDGEANDLLAGVEADEDFQKFASEVLGADYENIAEDQKLNALVLYTAQKTNGVDSNAILNGLQNNAGGLYNPGSDLDDATQIAGYAMQYALGLAYYREMYPENTNPEVADVLAVISGDNSNREVIGQDGRNPVYSEKTYFQEWLEENGQSNMDGFVGAMGLIADNTANVPADQLLANGYNNEDLLGMLNKMLGN